MVKKNIEFLQHPAKSLLLLRLPFGPFPLSDCDCDVVIMSSMGYIVTFPTGDCDVAIAIARMGSGPILAIAIAIS